MKTRILYLTILAVVSVSMSPLAAQQAQKKAAVQASQAAPVKQAARGKGAASQWKPAKLSDGQPDIQGMWGDVLENIASLNVEPGPYLLKIGAPPFGALKMFNGFMIDPPDGVIPHQPWAFERRNQAMKEFLTPSPAMMDPQTRGWPNGIPRQNYYSSIENGPFEILQPPGYVVFLYEIHHEFRVVPLDGRPQPGQDIKLWLGSSRGRWEGNTLVIEVMNNNDSTRFDVMGNFHSNEMKVTERWTIVDRNTIDYKATIDDPKVFTKPWTLGVKMVRAKPGTELLEYAGVEGDKAVTITAPAIIKHKETKTQ